MSVVAGIGGAGPLPRRAQRNPAKEVTGTQIRCTHAGPLASSGPARPGTRGSRTMRRTIALLVLAALATAGGGAASRSQTAPLSSATFVITGHGWGHGVGMPQWGAYGYAQQGWFYPRILAHYYPSTTLGPAPLARVRVLLKAGATTVSLSSA